MLVGKLGKISKRAKSQPLSEKKDNMQISLKESGLRKQSLSEYLVENALVERISKIVPVTP